MMETRIFEAIYNDLRLIAGCITGKLEMQYVPAQAQGTTDQDRRMDYASMLLGNIAGVVRGTLDLRYQMDTILASLVGPVHQQAQEETKQPQHQPAQSMGFGTYKAA